MRKMKRNKIIAVVMAMLMTAAVLPFVTSAEEAESGTHGIIAVGIPTMHITTEIDPFTAPRELWHDGTITMDSEIDEFSFENVEARIRGRGNSTWRLGVDKRPLRFRFNVARTMLDSEYAHRDWVLLANHFDRALIRNHTALYLGALLDGMDFTPMSRFVHLYVNGEYMGLYQLTDERDVGIGRANLTFDPDPTISEYFLELDWHSFDNPDAVEGEDYFMAGPRAYDLRWPSSNLNGHFEYAQSFITRTSSAIRSQNWEAISAIIDVPSFVDFYIVQELSKNVDVGWFSVFMTIRGQGDERRLYMGPLWDFDQSSGNSDNLVMYEEPRSPYPIISPYGLLAGEYNYWFRYLLGTVEFATAVADRWNEIRDNQIARTIENVEYMTTNFRADFERNFERHQIFRYPPEWEWINPEIIREIDTHAGQVEYLLNWLNTRVDWLGNHFNSLAAELAETAARRGRLVNPTGASVLVNGIRTEFEAYHIDGNNFFRLRDLAYALNGTEKQFSVEWDGAANAIILTSGQPYVPVGGEMAQGDGTPQYARATTSTVFLDGYEIDITAYNIGGNNFFRLRDIMRELDVGVTWDGATSTIGIDTSTSYSDPVTQD